MEEKIKEDLLATLNEVINILSVKEEKDVIELKELSNHTIHNASVFQDQDSVQLAVVIYALSKIIYREGGEIPKEIVVDIIKARDFLKKDQFKEYDSIIKRIFGKISRIDDKLKMYIEEVIEQGAIKKGSGIYAHGISMAQAADILGISQWDLMNYVGKTRIADISYGRKDVISRLKLARGLFR